MFQVAFSDDDSVICIRTKGGILIWEVRKIKIPDLAVLLSDLKIRYPSIVFVVDACGIGLGLMQLLNDQGIRPIVAHGSPIMKKRFKDKRSELHQKLLEFLQNGGKILSDSKWLRRAQSELLAVKYELTETGQLKILEKKLTHTKSPDILDALIYTFAGHNFHQDNVWT